MATWYVNSAATGSGAGTSWANACTTLSAAIALSAAGDDFNVLSTHSESMNGVTLVFKGTAAAPNRVFSCGNTNSPAQASDLLPGATFTNSGGTNFFWQGYAYFYGLTINHTGDAGAFFPSYAGPAQTYVGCTFTTRMCPGFNGVSVTPILEFIDCTFALATHGDAFFQSSGTVSCINCTFSSAATGALVDASFGNAIYLFDGCDISAFGSGKTLVSATTVFTQITFLNCKLGAGVTVTAANTTPQSSRVDVINSDSGATGYRMERYRFAGTLTTDTVDIRSGGASDGVTPVAWKVTTNSNTGPVYSFECFEIATWCGQVGAPVTLAIPIMSNATLTNADIWPEVEYLGDATTPKASRVSGAPATALTAGTAWPLDGVSSWTTTGVTGPVQQVMNVTFTPRTVGDVRVKIKIAKPSLTVRIDPKPQGIPGT